MRTSELSKSYFDPNSAFQTFKKDLANGSLQGDQTYVLVDNESGTTTAGRIYGHFTDENGVGALVAAADGSTTWIYPRGLHQITQPADAKALFEAKKFSLAQKSPVRNLAVEPKPAIAESVPELEIPHPSFNQLMNGVNPRASEIPQRNEFSHRRFGSETRSAHDGK